MSEETFNSIEDNIFLLRNEIVKLRMNNKMDEGKKQLEISELRERIEAKEKQQQRLWVHHIGKADRKQINQPKINSLCI